MFCTQCVSTVLILAVILHNSAFIPLFFEVIVLLTTLFYSSDFTYHGYYSSDDDSSEYKRAMGFNYHNGPVRSCYDDYI